MTAKELEQKIDELNVTKKYFAEKAGIDTNLFYKICRGEEQSTVDQQVIIHETIKDIEAEMSHGDQNTVPDANPEQDLSKQLDAPSLEKIDSPVPRNDDPPVPNEKTKTETRAEYINRLIAEDKRKHTEEVNKRREAMSKEPVRIEYNLKRHLSKCTVEVISDSKGLVRAKGLGVMDQPIILVLKPTLAGYIDQGTSELFRLLEMNFVQGSRIEYDMNHVNGGK